MQEGALVRDETSGTNEQPLAYAKSNLRIIFDDELRDGFTSIKIAELIRTPTGQLKIADDYIPPILKSAGSPWLANMLQQLVEILITKSGSLGEQRRQRKSGLADFTTSDAGVFWLLHTINSSIPTITHFFHSPLLHPEKLYIEMATLAGKLMTFSTEFHPKDIIKYDHDDLYLTFQQLICPAPRIARNCDPESVCADPTRKNAGNTVRRPSGGRAFAQGCGFLFGRSVANAGSKTHRRRAANSQDLVA